MIDFKKAASFIGGEDVFSKEISPARTIAISATTVTPLMQVGEGGLRKRYVYEGDMAGPEPFFSANGIRGALRRIAFKQQVELAKAAGASFDVSPDIFYLYTSGGGFGKRAASLVESFAEPGMEEKVREAAPILDVFGAGLSQVEGAVAVSDMVPRRSVERWKIAEKDGATYAYSNLVDGETFFRSDSLKGAGLFRSVLDMEEVKRWREEYDEMVKKAQEKKKSGESEKEEFSNVQQPVSMEFIIPGIPMVASISPKYGRTLDEVRLGMVASSLRELSLMQIGSAKRIGFGVLEWRVEIDGVEMFATKCDKDYVLKRESILTKEGEELVGAWKAWASANGSRLEGFF